MNPASPSSISELDSEIERLYRLRRDHPVVYAWTVGRRRTVTRVAGWTLVAILLFIAAAFAKLASLFAAGTTPRYMFATVSFILVSIALGLLTRILTDPTRRMTRMDVARQDAEELLGPQGP